MAPSRPSRFAHTVPAGIRTQRWPDPLPEDADGPEGPPDAPPESVAGGPRPGEEKVPHVPSAGEQAAARLDTLHEARDAGYEREAPFKQRVGEAPEARHLHHDDPVEDLRPRHGDDLAAYRRDDPETEDAEGRRIEQRPDPEITRILERDLPAVSPQYLHHVTGREVVEQCRFVPYAFPPVLLNVPDGSVDPSLLFAAGRCGDEPAAELSLTLALPKNLLEELTATPGRDLIYDGTPDGPSIRNPPPRQGRNNRGIDLLRYEKDRLTALPRFHEDAHTVNCLRNPSYAESTERRWAASRHRMETRVDRELLVANNPRYALRKARDYSEAFAEPRAVARYAGRVCTALGLHVGAILDKAGKTADGYSPTAALRVPSRVSEMIERVKDSYPSIAAGVAAVDPDSPLAHEPEGAGPRWRRAVIDGLDRHAAVLESRADFPIAPPSVLRSVAEATRSCEIPEPPRVRSDDHPPPPGRYDAALRTADHVLAVAGGAVRYASASPTDSPGPGQDGPVAADTPEGPVVTVPAGWFESPAPGDPPSPCPVLASPDPSLSLDDSHELFAGRVHALCEEVAKHHVPGALPAAAAGGAPDGSFERSISDQAVPFVRDTLVAHVYGTPLPPIHRDLAPEVHFSARAAFDTLEQENRQSWNRDTIPDRLEQGRAVVDRGRALAADTADAFSTGRSARPDLVAFSEPGAKRPEAAVPVVDRLQPSMARPGENTAVPDAPGYFQAVEKSFRELRTARAEVHEFHADVGEAIYSQLQRKGAVPLPRASTPPDPREVGEQWADTVDRDLKQAPRYAHAVTRVAATDPPDVLARRADVREAVSAVISVVKSSLSKFRKDRAKPELPLEQPAAPASQAPGLPDRGHGSAPPASAASRSRGPAPPEPAPAR